MLRKIIQSLAAAIVLTGVSAGVQAATVAMFDVSVSVSGSISDTPLGTASISGGGSGGTGILDNNGIFTVNDLDPLLVAIQAGSGFLSGTANLNWAVNSTVTGSYASVNATTSSLTGNTAVLIITENSPCSGSGFLGDAICDEVSNIIDISQPFILTAADGLTDPLTFDLANSSSFILGQLGGATTLTMTLTNPVVSPVPVPAAAWLFGSAMLGLMGVARRRKA
jgi:hypothetical protein